jgi:hypothetical protein
LLITAIISLMNGQGVLRILGIIFLALGVIGFFNDPVFGIFEVNTMHNVVHLLLGGIALYCSSSRDKTAVGGKILTFANILLIVSMMPVSSHQMVMGLDVNPADHLLHIPFLLASIWVGFFTHNRHANPAHA